MRYLHLKTKKDILKLGYIFLDKAITP